MSLIPKRIIDHIFEVEGGFVDRPEDKGGPTKYGITWKTLETAFKQGVVKHNNIKELTKEEAEAIYYKYYWTLSKSDWIYEQFGEDLALIHFDSAVNHGISRAQKFWQGGINKILGEEKLKVDGVIGPITQKVSKEVLSDEKIINGFKWTYLCLRSLFYTKIVRRDYSQRVFLFGWMNRIVNLASKIDLK